MARQARGPSAAARQAREPSAAARQAREPSAAARVVAVGGTQIFKIEKKNFKRILPLFQNKGWGYQQRRLKVFTVYPRTSKLNCP